MKKLSSLFWICAGSLWSISPVYAQSNDCDQIRAVKKIANQQGLDDSTLTTLEAQYCGVSSNQACDDITLLYRFASLSGAESSTLKQINKKREATCSLGAALGSWSSGSYVRDSSNNLFYPSGNYAKNSKTWYYPNGNTASSGPNQWYYPNGNIFKDPKKKKGWFDPNGNQLDPNTLLSQACDKVSESFCNDSISSLKAASYEESLSMQFVWVAWNTKPTNDTAVSNNQDCADLNTMYRLATLSSNDKGLLKSIASRQKTACSTGLNGADWSNGTTAKYTNGSWNYPNGTTAKYTNGSWNYADGTTAKYTNGSWNYSNGTTAKYTNGNWNDPSGSSIKVDDLLVKSCERLPELECSNGLSLIKSSSGDERILGIIEFASLAWSWKGSTGSYNPPKTSQNTPDNSYENTQDCTTLDFMGRVALLGGGNNDLLNTIEKKRKSVCASGTEASSLSWSTGITAKSSSGSWSYPNGITAKSSSGSWSYPNGITAKSSSGSWSYPNGITAKSSSGSWSDPSGVSSSVDNLLTKACKKLPEQLCQDGLQSIKTLSGDDKVFGILEFSYTAWSYVKGGY
jgi:hypothetical protein